MKDDTLEAVFLRVLRDRRANGLKLEPGTIAAQIDALDPRQAEAMRLYYLEDLSQVAIAAKMGVTQKAVSKLLKKGRRRLLEQLVC